jgi:hypothetical protein
MSLMLTKALLSVLLLASAGIVQAQEAIPTSSQPQTASTLSLEQKTQLARQDQQMSEAATAIVQMIDQGRLDEVWRGASSVAKNVTNHDSFVKQLIHDRKILGTVTSRTVSGVTRSQSDGKSSLPAGLYISVRFSTQFSATRQAVRELVSFYLDTDQIWRLAGYSVR